MNFINTIGNYLGEGGLKFLFIGLMFTVFYFFIIRPKQKQEQELAQKKEELRRQIEQLQLQQQQVQQQQQALAQAHEKKRSAFRSMLKGGVPHEAAGGGAPQDYKPKPFAPAPVVPRRGGAPHGDPNGNPDGHGPGGPGRGGGGRGHGGGHGGGHGPFRGGGHGGGAGLPNPKPKPEPKVEVKPAVPVESKKTERLWKMKMDTCPKFSGKPQDGDFLCWPVQVQNWFRMNKVVNELDKRDIVWTYGLTGPAKRLIDTQLVIHSEDPRAGDTVHLRANPERIHFFDPESGKSLR